MNYKSFQVKYSDEGNGSLEGYASTWIRRPDSWGDVVKEGAFAKTLQERWNGGTGIPLLWAHQMNELSSYIGTASAEEDEKGLHFVAAFDGTDEAQRVRELYKDGRLSKFSFAYDVKEEALVTLEDGVKANELRELDLYEISCVCVPANDDAGVVGVKAEVPEAKDGRRNSAKDAAVINQIITLAKSLLDDEVNEPEEEDEPKGNAAAEDPKVSNSEEKEKLLTFIKNNGGKS